jgi:hypothetical protein
LRELILCSYRLVIAGLSKKKRREIGLEPMADSVKGNKHGAARRRD